MKKALIAMSGGVDSSVAAYLMQQQGWDCMGATMTLYRNEDIGLSRSRTCCSLEDVEDARSVAHKLNMPYYVFNFSDEFRCQVMDRFADAYERQHKPVRKKVPKPDAHYPASVLPYEAIHHLNDLSPHI